MKLPILVSCSEYLKNVTGVPYTPRPYRAWCPYFPEAYCEGVTEEEAIAQLQKALETVIKNVTLHEIELP